MKCLLSNRYICIQTLKYCCARVENMESFVMLQYSVFETRGLVSGGSVGAYKNLKRKFQFNSSWESMRVSQESQVKSVSQSVASVSLWLLCVSFP